MACYACKKDGNCIQKDDVAAILEKMAGADVIVLATPVYYYSMTGQLKTLIDRTLPCYYTKKSVGKMFTALSLPPKKSLPWNAPLTACAVLSNACRMQRSRELFMAQVCMKR